MRRLEIAIISSSAASCSCSAALNSMTKYRGTLFFNMITEPFSSTRRATLEKFWLASVIETRFFVLIFITRPPLLFTFIISQNRRNSTYFQKLQAGTVKIFMAERPRNERGSKWTKIENKWGIHTFCEMKWENRGKRWYERNRMRLRAQIYMKVRKKGKGICNETYEEA